MCVEREYGVGNKLIEMTLFFTRFVLPTLTKIRMNTELIIHESKEFADFNYSECKLRNREFYKCKFINCNFNKSDLREVYFEDCCFINSDLSMANVSDVGFRNVIFDGCKMLGVDFSVCSKFAASFAFNDCIMNYCCFISLKLKRTVFKKCSLKEVDFSFSDLSAAVFDCCNLEIATFSNTLLEKADFRTSENVTLDLEENKVKKARFSSVQLEGLLHKYQLDIS